MSMHDKTTRRPTNRLPSYVDGDFTDDADDADDDDDDESAVISMITFQTQLDHCHIQCIALVVMVQNKTVTNVYTL